MIRAGALYLSIVIAFFIAILSASVIMLAAHYRNSYSKNLRYSRLLNNLDAAVSIALAGDSLSGSQKMDLYGSETDSITTEAGIWGIYGCSKVSTYILQDTLSRIFLTGTETGTDRTAMYLSDEDRPVSVSGETRITGDAELPKSGIRQSYVAGKPYSGEQMVYGRSLDSKRTLPALNERLLKKIMLEAATDFSTLEVCPESDQTISFMGKTRRYKLSGPTTLSYSLSGNLILFSDTTVTLSAESTLNLVQIYAPYIKIEDGFKGNCQLFASDSISVGNRVTLNYPSALCVIRKEESKGQPKISLGNSVSFNGILLSYEAVRTPMQTSIQLGKDNQVNGEIYSCGLIQMEKGLVVKGKVSCNRFLMKTSSALYENFLVDVTLNRKARNRYYLSSSLFTASETEKKVLKWLQ